MLDIKLIRENPELVKNNLAKRGNPENARMLDELIALDKEWRQNLTKLNDFRHERKVITTEIATLKKAGKDVTSNVDKAKTIDAQITSIEKEVVRAEEKTHDYLMRLPNLLHETVPVGQGENDNVQVRTWGTIPRFGFTIKNHIDAIIYCSILFTSDCGFIARYDSDYRSPEGVLLDVA